MSLFIVLFPHILLSCFEHYSADTIFIARKHSGNRNPGTERTPDWTQTFAPDCGKDGLGPLLSESFTPPRSGALSFSRLVEVITRMLRLVLLLYVHY